MTILFRIDILYIDIIIIITLYIVQGGENEMVNKKQTSPKVASKASEILKSKNFSSKSKTVAGSALSQTKKKK